MSPPWIERGRAPDRHACPRRPRRRQYAGIGARVPGNPEWRGEKDMLIRMCFAATMVLLAACGGKGGRGIEVSVPFPIVPPITPATEPLVVNSTDWFSMIGVGAAIDGPRD